MSPAEYEAQKVAVADEICKRLEKIWPGISAAIEFREVRGPGTLWWLNLACHKELDCQPSMHTVFALVQAEALAQRGAPGIG